MSAKAKKGSRIRARVHHNGVRSGTEGKVVGVYTGTFYAVNYPGVSGVCYSPDTHVSVPGSPEAPTPVNTSSPSAARERPKDAWAALLDEVVEPG